MICEFHDIGIESKKDSTDSCTVEKEHAEEEGSSKHEVVEKRT
jgi:hypothetical protein